MSKEAVNSAQPIESVKKIYDAINRNDMTTYLSFFDPKIERLEFGTRLQGLDALKTNLSNGRDQWAEGSCQPETFSVVDDKIVVFVHVRVRLKNRTEWIDGQVTDVFAFEGAKVVQFCSFADRNEAMAWAAATRA